jgi:DNA-binding ferritin-like protein
MNKPTVDKPDDLRRRQGAPLATPNDLERGATADIAGALNAILADVFAMYLKTKNFHWHMSGPHFRDCHLMLDEHADGHRDIASASLIEVWIDETERRTWFLFEASRRRDSSSH